MGQDRVDLPEVAKFVAPQPATERRSDDQDHAAAGTAVSQDGTCVVVWLRGEHDAANSSALLATLSGALAAAGLSVVVDLSGVSFIGAATIGVIIQARSLAISCGQTFSVRSPSRQALRILGLCGLLEIIDHVFVGPVPGSALASWVTVPASDRVPAVAPVEPSTGRVQAPSSAERGA